MMQSGTLLSSSSVASIRNFMQKISSPLAHLNLIKDPIFYKKHFDRKKYWSQYQFNCQTLTDFKSEEVSGWYFQNERLAGELKCISSYLQKLLIL